MKKSIYTTILVILTVCCIIGGTIFHILGWFSSFSLLPWNWGNSSDKLNTQRETYSASLDEFSTVKIEGSVMDVTIQTGNDYHLSYDCVAYLVPEVKLSAADHSLEIIQPTVPQFGIGVHNNHCEMTLTVPDTCSLEDLTLLSDVGDIDLVGIKSETANIQSDVGDVEIDRCSFHSSELRMDVGDLKVKNSSLEICVADSDVGDMDFISCDFTSLDACGDVGDIEIVLEKDDSAYGIDLCCDIGDVYVDGEKYKQNYRTHSGNEHSSGFITGSTSSGDIRLTYK